MPQRNEFTEAILELVQEYKQLTRDSKDSKVPPFMSDRLNSEESAKRFSGMSQEERRRVVEKMGVEEAMKLVKSINGGV
jgi:hypothetical protein|tara:strand:- start:51 stop:287 length:237 start_codon:yes stop_codon:yes gene_type:complete